VNPRLPIYVLICLVLAVAVNTACRQTAHIPGASTVSTVPEQPPADAPTGGAIAATAETTDPPAYDGTDEARAVAEPSAWPEASAADQASPPVRSCPSPETGRRPPPAQMRPAAPPAIGATAAVVIDGDSGAVLWGRNEHLALQPASVTKILTAMIAIERGNLDEIIPVTVEQRLLNRGSKMGLVEGDWFTLRDLLYGLMLPSGNDAAAVIAYHFAGSEQAFAGLMNDRLCELGLVDSLFINPSGLGRGEYNLASAYDLAMLSRVAMENPTFREIAGTRFWTAKGSRTLSMRNLNELVGTYAGADGVKIGWTPGAGNTIVGSATRNGHRVIVALLNTPNRAGESAALLEWVFRNFAWSG
jgi:D-alanyl-D-alanine carboxypeptidase (penicillin-binding protein 5/6)